MSAEEEIQIEMPNEPHITNPKTSPITRASGHYRTKIHLFREINIVAPLSKAKFPVYLAKADSDDERVFAMKVFPLDDDNEPSTYFKNEARFASLNHENIIKAVHVEQKKTVTHNNIAKTISFILLEYAPYGDFFNFVTKHRDHFNEKLVRTYFRQLVEGLEYLHRKNAAHLDLKLENLLLGEDFTLKIADFDLSYFENDSKILTTGTKFYRSPELMASVCKNCPAADIYSAGILLFVLKTGGVIPHSEDIVCRGVSLIDLLYDDNAEFWKAHCRFQQKSMSFFSPDFRALFNGMTKENPEERLSLQDVKNSNWYNGPIYSKEDLKEYVASFIKQSKSSC